MKKIILVVLVVIALLAQNSCKKDVQEDGLYFTVSTDRAFYFTRIVISEDGKTIYNSDVTHVVNEPYNYTSTLDQGQFVKGRRLSIIVSINGEGDKINGQLKIKGKEIPFSNVSINGADGSTMKEWIYNF